MKYCTDEEVINMIQKDMLKVGQNITFINKDGSLETKGIAHVVKKTNRSKPGVRVYYEYYPGNISRYFVHAHKIMIKKATKRKLKI